MTIISKDINLAIEFLNKEDVVSIPTETVYGLAGNIFSEKAVNKIFNLKRRPLFNPLIVHTHSIGQLEKIASVVPDKALKLAEAFWPGPLTLILPKQKHIPDLVTAGKKTVGIRVPNHPMTLKLLSQLEFPLAAPSANPFGSISPTSANHVKEYFDGKLSMVLDGGDCFKGIESTIVGFETEGAVTYRLGSISIEDITSVIGDVMIKTKKEKAPDAPGMLSRHYAPDTTTYLVDDIDDFLQDTPDLKIGLITFQGLVKASNVISCEVLSASGDLNEAASNLYAALHRLDRLNLDVILAEKFPDTGLGRSINDRLERATKSK